MTTAASYGVLICAASVPSVAIPALNRCREARRADPTKPRVRVVRVVRGQCLPARNPNAPLQKYIDIMFRFCSTPRLMFDPDEIAERQAGLARHMSARLNALAERVFDQQPPVVTANPTTFSTPTSSAYDRIGRYVTAGVRFDF